MKKGILLSLPFILSGFVADDLSAQDSAYHPALTDPFEFSVGAFRSDNSFKMRAEGKTVNIDGDDIDFGNSVGVDEGSTLANVQLGWNFGKARKWTLMGQYFANDASGSATLEEDVEWQDVVFKEGTFVDAGVKIEVIRLFVGRSLFKNEQSDFGIGAGIHNLDLSAYIGGEIITEEVDTGYRRVKASNSAPLPNIGAWYRFSPTKRWLLFGRIDWISADIGDYDGSLWNTNIGFDYQFTDHFGGALYWQYFELDLNVTKSDWKGGAALKYNGPVLGVTFNW